MKIILVNKYLYPKGGDAISTLSTGKLLSDRGHDVVFWGMDHPLNRSYPYEDLFVSNVDYDNPKNIKEQIKFMLNIFYSFEAKEKFRKLIELVKPDIIHLNNFAHQISPSILHVARKYNIPIVMTMRDYKLVCPTYSMLLNGKPCEKCKNAKYYRCFMNRCTKRSFLKSLINASEMYLHHCILNIYSLIDIVIATSEFLKAKHAEMGLHNRIIYLPNFVDLTEYTPEYRWQENSIIYFGRLSAEKGLFTLLEAVKGLDVKLKIIGDGPLLDVLVNETRSKELKNVCFMGFKRGNELKNEIKKSKFIVVPSEWYEAFGRTNIESFALGKPVIGARIGAIPELVKDNFTGLTFQAGNVSELRSKIEYLIQHPEMITQMGINARKFVEREFNEEKHYAELLKIYSQAISGKGKYSD